jgi:predicted transcriptional regulator of viral defense system
MRTSELKVRGVHYDDIQTLMNRGTIEKIRRGYYNYVDENQPNEIDIVKRFYPDAVLCMETALFYHGYSDRSPASWNLAVNKDESKYRVKISYPFVKIYFSEPHILDIGLSEAEIDGVSARIYDKDRTICDCLRHMNSMDREIFNKAVQRYVGDPKKNIPKLTEYAKQLRTQKKVRDLIEVWL